MSSGTTVAAVSTVAAFVTNRLKEIGKSQKQVATECGFDNANVVTMLKQGLTKIPLGRITAIARALEVDATFLMRLTMREYQPDLWSELERSLAAPMLSSHERELIEKVRAANAGGDPAYKVEVIGTTVKLGTSLKKLPEELVAEPSGRFQTRFLIRNPHLGWKIIPMSKVLPIFRGQECIAELAGKSSAVVQVELERFDDRSPRLLSMSPLQWVFGAEGYVDQKIAFAETLAEMNAQNSSMSGTVVPVLSKDDVQAIKKILGLA